ncbi:hypothetical protein L596_013587 [Steinernema carpocapsae]|uniref:ATPase AAA-type core domain-containing protein n=1 Tax=Steinernema carpocapsae TaxID=34508 RepID=A0A4U5P196_STECR|nr:hypothetical protein L596_013587 [Steinernema carpocapsae]
MVRWMNNRAVVHAQPDANAGPRTVAVMKKVMFVAGGVAPGASAIKELLDVIRSTVDERDKELDNLVARECVSLKERAECADAIENRRTLLLALFLVSIYDNLNTGQRLSTKTWINELNGTRTNFNGLPTGFAVELSWSDAKAPGLGNYYFVTLTATTESRESSERLPEEEYADYDAFHMVSVRLNDQEAATRTEMLQISSDRSRGSDDVDKNVTPSLKAPKVKKPSKATNENKLDGIDLLNSSGDSDSVIPKRVKEHMQIVEAPSTSGTKRRVCISSDEDEEFQRKKKPEPKRRKQRSPSPAPVEPMDLSDVEEDEEIQEVPAKRGKTKQDSSRPNEAQLRCYGSETRRKSVRSRDGEETISRPRNQPQPRQRGRLLFHVWWSKIHRRTNDAATLNWLAETKETKQFEVVDLDSPAPSPKKAKKSKEEPPKKAKPASPKKAAKEPVKPKARDERKPSSFENVSIFVPSKQGCGASQARGIGTNHRNSLMWVDKYKPLSLKQLVGQSGEKSPMNKLLGWLRDWPKFHMGEAAHQKKAKPAPWMAQSDGSAFKAALLSGPPGIGKTTCAAMACKELGIEMLETNASDARSKKCLEAVLGDLTGSHQINRMFGEQKKPVEKDALTHVLIMDEVDGMSGNEDRAGIAELI